MNKKQPKKAIFDPKKNYQWEPDAEFIIKGKELEFILQTLYKAISTPETKTILQTVDAFKIAQGLIAKGYDKGIVKEVPLPTKK